MATSRLKRTLTFSITGALLSTGALASGCQQRYVNPGPVQEPMPKRTNTGPTEGAHQPEQPRPEPRPIEVGPGEEGMEPHGDTDTDGEEGGEEGDEEAKEEGLPRPRPKRTNGSRRPVPTANPAPNKP